MATEFCSDRMVAADKEKLTVSIDPEVPVGLGSVVLDKVAFVGRTFEDYVCMFGLDKSVSTMVISPVGRDIKEMEFDTSISILDCSAGPAAFKATGSSRYKLDITAADPRYSYSATDLEAIMAQNVETAFEILDRVPLDQLPIKFDANKIQKVKQDHRDAMQAFLADFKSDRAQMEQDGDGTFRSKYVSASLPRLPFLDKSFDLVLCGNFLFAYSPKESGGVMAGAGLKENLEHISKKLKVGDDDSRFETVKCSTTSNSKDVVFDEAFHLAAVRELARVCSRELRLMPTGWMVSKDVYKQHAFVPAIVECLTRDLGFRVKFVSCEYEGYLGMSEVLIANRIYDETAVEDSDEVVVKLG
jgi:hypothetical protein